MIVSIFSPPDPAAPPAAIGKIPLITELKPSVLANDYIPMKINIKARSKYIVRPPIRAISLPVVSPIA